MMTINPALMPPEIPPEVLERHLFDEALDLPPGPERDTFLAAACRDNESLRQRLLALLRVEAQESHFLPESPAALTTPPAEDAAKASGHPNRSKP